MDYCAKRAGSTTALARQAGISQSGIRRYFRGGDPSRRHLIAIANAAGVSVEWLATGEAGGAPEDKAPSVLGDNWKVALVAQFNRYYSEDFRGRNLYKGLKAFVDEVQPQDPAGNPLSEGELYDLIQEVDPGVVYPKPKYRGENHGEIPFLPGLSAALARPIARQTEGRPDESTRRQWLTKNVYTLLWRLYEQRADLLEELKEEDVEPVVEVANEAYHRLYPGIQLGDTEEEAR